MIEINLLPSGAARRPAARRPVGGGGMPRLGADPRVAAVGAAAVLLLLLAAGWWWRAGQQRAALETQVAEERADSVKLQRAIAVLQAMDTRRDTIDRKMDVIRSVDGRRFVWPHILDEVSRATPPHMWLTRLAAADDEGGGEAAAPAAAPAPGDTAKADSAAAAAAAAAAFEGPSFTVEGNAGSTQALTRFMKNLEASPMVRDVALVTSEQTDALGRAVLKFTLEARWEQPDSAYIQSVPLIAVR
ncbi:MAG TPA: PilN domain-containing protein [Longimicrobium sp.]|nr:PilN domain-containing protein [Longimicrobium sp.]